MLIPPYTDDLDLGEFKTLKAAVSASYKHSSDNSMKWYQVKNYFNQDEYWWTTDVWDQNSSHYEIDREE